MDLRRGGEDNVDRLCYHDLTDRTIPLQHPETHKITDFFSFYSLPSSIINHPKHGVLEAAYLFYYATDVAFDERAEEEGRLKRRLLDLIGDALVIADQTKFDVFNALTLMDNVPILQELKVCPSHPFTNIRPCLMERSCL